MCENSQGHDSSMWLLALCLPPPRFSFQCAHQDKMIVQQIVQQIPVTLLIFGAFEKVLRQSIHGKINFYSVTFQLLVL